MEDRFDELYMPLQFLSHKILVCCPSCSNKGLITLEGDDLLGENRFLKNVWNDLGYIGSIYTQNYNNPKAKLTCLTCGKQAKGNPISVFRQPSEPKDPYFGYFLYLNKDLPQGTLWVYNRMHLELLYKYIKASSRIKAFDYKCDYLGSANDKIEKELDSLYGDLLYDEKKRARLEHLNKFSAIFPLNRDRREKFAHSFSENLPKWIKLAKNKKIVLAALDKLRQQAE